MWDWNSLGHVLENTGFILSCWLKRLLKRCVGGCGKVRGFGHLNHPEMGLSHHLHAGQFRPSLLGTCKDSTSNILPPLHAPSTSPNPTTMHLTRPVSPPGVGFLPLSRTKPSSPKVPPLPCLWVAPSQGATAKATGSWTVCA